MMGYFPGVKKVMQYCRGGKKSKRFSPGSDFTEQIFAGELSWVDSAGVMRQDVFTEHLWTTASMYFVILSNHMLHSI